MSRQARERREPEPPRMMDLVKVGRANNQAEAEFLQGLLLEEGVPSVVQRGQGSDVPDFLAPALAICSSLGKTRRSLATCCSRAMSYRRGQVPAPPTGRSA